MSRSGVSPRATARLPRAAAGHAAVSRLAGLVASGIPLGDALAAGGRAGGEAGRILAAVSRAVSKGRRLSHALAGAAGLTAPELALVAAGEASGQLERALQLLDERMAHRAESRHRFSRALVYPLLLIALTIVIVIAMGVFVVPTFADMYVGLGVALPRTTRGLIVFSEMVIAQALPLTFGCCAVAGVLIAVVRAQPRVRRWVHGTMLEIPGLGRSLQVSAKQELYATLAALLTAGIELDRAIELTTPAVTNLELRRRLSKVGDLVRRGWLPSAAIIRAGLDPDGRDAGLIKTAEAGGDYAGCFGRLAAVAATERDERSALLARLLEPTAVLIMAVAVGLTVLGVYQPILGSATLLIGDLK